MTDEIGAKLERRMHGEARLRVHLAKMDGFSFDKKVLRFNDIVDVAFRYGRCGGSFSEAAAWGGLQEAIEACSPDFPEMYAPQSVLSLCPEWMLVSKDPRND